MTDAWHRFQHRLIYSDGQYNSILEHADLSHRSQPEVMQIFLQATASSLTTQLVLPCQRSTMSVQLHHHIIDAQLSQVILLACQAPLVRGALCHFLPSLSGASSLFEHHLPAVLEAGDQRALLR